jgi:outer membrane biosynthesis protein TonB
VPFRLPTSEFPDKQWQKSLFLTIAVHVSFLLFGFLAPRFLHFQQKIPEVYTVNLFSVDDLGGPAPAAPSKAAVAAPQAAPPQPKAAPEPVVKPTPPQKTQPVPEPPAVAKDAISLKPIKTKEKADIDKVKKLRDILLAENREKQAKDAAEKAKADADKKAKDAVNQLTKALMAGQQAAAGKAAASAAATAQGGSGTGSGAGGGGVMVDENLRRYLIAVNSQIQEHWVLPDLQNWKENVEAIVIIRVRRDGAVVESTFKKKSDNVFFNQFVEKTLKLSAPLPPFPIGINQSEMEIGLKFRPGEVF